MLSADDYRLGRLDLTLQNPSSSEMKRIRISVVDISQLWGVFAEGTFLSGEEIRAIQTNVIKSPTQAALPEIGSLPPGGMIKVSFYGLVRPYTTPRVTAENADVKMVELLPVEKNSFLDLYQSYFLRGFVYILLWAAALSALSWSIQRGMSGAQSPTPDAGTSQATPESDPQKGADPADRPFPK